MIGKLTGDDLEDYGHQVFSRMQVPCFHKLNHTRLDSLDPEGPYTSDEHLELDYLIPYQDVCLLGEITARRDPSNVRDKYNKFRNHYTIINNLDLNEDVWRLLGVPEESLRQFRWVRTLRGFFLTTRLQEFDLSLIQVPNIVPFYKSSCKLLEEYSQSIGSYAKPHFLHRFNVLATTGRRPLEIKQDRHGLMQTPDKKIASGDIGIADLYTFEASPYELLPIAEVYRRDRLPSLNPSTESEYQRPLIPKKINEIRQNLLTDPEFIFPSSILCVLSEDCQYDETAKALTIPEEYGAISVIDGQHRLFSYADAGVKERVGEDSRIMVTAIHFRDSDVETIHKYSARTFVEINTNQTPVRPSHLDAIAYEVLEEKYPRALAAQVLWRANVRRSSKLYGIFDTDQTGLGFVSISTVLTALKSLTNRERVSRLQSATRGSPLNERRGYENLFGATIGGLSDAEILIQHGVTCLEQYFNRVARVFFLDWSTRDDRKNSSLAYAKIIFAFIRLLRTFVSEGLDWIGVQEELETIRSNVLQVRNMDNYDDVLFDPENTDVPNAQFSATDNYRFLERNRSAPTKMENIEAERG